LFFKFFIFGFVHNWFVNMFFWEQYLLICYFWFCKRGNLWTNNSFWLYLPLVWSFRFLNSHCFFLGYVGLLMLRFDLGICCSYMNDMRLLWIVWVLIDFSSNYRINYMFTVFDIICHSINLYRF
jgi:hypothetical protein